MNKGEGIYDQVKVNATMTRCVDAARDEGCNMYETYKAFEALYETSKQMIFGTTADGRDE